MTIIYKVAYGNRFHTPHEFEFTGDDALEQANAEYTKGKSGSDWGHIIAIDPDVPDKVDYINSFDSDYMDFYSNPDDEDGDWEDDDADWGYEYEPDPDDYPDDDEDDSFDEEAEEEADAA